MRSSILATLLLIATGALAADAAPRNLILMIADGAGFEHFRAASLHATGRPDAQVVWRFPVTLAMSTYPAGGHYDPQQAWSDERWLSDKVTDSAASITAITTGVKTHNKRLCVDVDGQPIPTLTERLEDTGRATGVVSSVMFVHATPAGTAISHPVRKDYEQIARKMLTESAIDVIMGPGHPLFDARGEPAVRPDYELVGGQDLWNGLQRGLVGGDADRDGDADRWSVIHTREQFQQLIGAGEPPARVLGIPQVHETLQQERAGDLMAGAFVVPPNPAIPTLGEMTLGALNVLSRDRDGFGVMIEGGAVDWASHDGQPGRMIEEQRDFDLAVAAVVNWIEERDLWDETLLVVTSDHECGYLCAPTGEGPMPAIAPVAAGEMPAMEFRTGQHSHALVPLFARGAGAAGLRDLADEDDPVRGTYLDSAELGAFLVQVMTGHPVHEPSP